MSHLDSTEGILTGQPLGGVGQGQGRVLVVRHRQGNRLLCRPVAEELRGETLAAQLLK